MYGHISRFISHPDEKITASLNPILGGPGWKDRLDPLLKPGPAVELLFRETLKAAGKFDHVVSTKIDKSTQERPHFFLAYGTKDRSRRSKRCPLRPNVKRYANMRGTAQQQ